ncbi:nuclear transport factor 2 family protein [Pseudooceanicola sp. LIPI14-2-Ac024]|uniref:nuclear transport factor 2 family protein n=1 Tax=Pseudooceanicola sp. LIPI14-2-Ac024 TaxID=3344875 RepID=UPI0035CEF1E0
MTDPRQIADAYIDIWNTADPAGRQAKIAALWTEDAQFADPVAQAAGRAEIAALIGTVRDTYPDMTFAVTGTPDGFGEMVRFGWSMAAPGTAPVVRGTDIATCRDGRIATVTGFFDLVPQGAVPA